MNKKIENLIHQDDLDDAKKQIDECVPEKCTTEFGPTVIQEGLTVADTIKKNDAINYVFADHHSIFTVETTKHGYKHTYRVKPTKDPDWYAVAVLYGPDNGKDYRNIGFVEISKPLFYTNTSWKLEHCQPVQMFAAFMDVMFNKEPWPEKCKFYKSQHCLKCGKRLTTPESIERGYGPGCWDLINSVK